MKQIFLVLFVFLTISFGLELPEKVHLQQWEQELKDLKVDHLLEGTNLEENEFKDFIKTFSLTFLQSFQPNSGDMAFEKVIEGCESSRPSSWFDESKEISSGNALDDCRNCKLLGRTIQGIWFRNETQELVLSVVKKVCPVLHNRDIIADYICVGAIDTFGHEVIMIVGHIIFEPLEMCIFRGKCPKTEIPPFEITFPAPKPPVTPPTPPSNTTTKAYVLHFTDIHYDPKYTVGLEAECGEPLCCRPPNPSGPSVIRPAGKFGDYNCDAPRELIEDMLKFVGENLTQIYNFQFGIWSGDIPPHDVWESEKNNYVSLMKEMAELFQETLPTIPMFPAVGNHESIPVDFFAPKSIREPEFSIDWLYEALANQWAPWLTSDAVETLRSVGNYELTLSSGIRIVSVNDMMCSESNQWLRMRWEDVCCKDERSDPDGTLVWLVNILQDAENKKQKVYLIRHVPNSSRCTQEWSNNYYSIVDRYESTIVAIFSGHIHNDEFKIYYRDREAKQDACAIEYVGPSATPFTNGNPAFRVYEIDLATNMIIDHITYYIDLDKANADGFTTWEVEYSAKKTFGMENVFPEDWHKLTVEFEDNQELFDQYFKFFHKSYLNGRTCTDSCKDRTICGMRTARTRDPCPSSEEAVQKKPIRHECWEKN